MTIFGQIVLVIQQNNYSKGSQKHEEKVLHQKITFTLLIGRDCSDSPQILRVYHGQFQNSLQILQDIRFLNALEYPKVITPEMYSKCYVEIIQHDISSEVGFDERVDEIN